MKVYFFVPGAQIPITWKECGHCVDRRL